MVKGTSKRVVVVKSPDPKFFEQAIFILREDLRGKGTDKSGEVLREAQKVADDYVKNYISEPKNFLAKLPPSFFAAVGAAAGIIVTVLVCYLL